MIRRRRKKIIGQCRVFLVKRECNMPIAVQITKTRTKDLLTIVGSRTTGFAHAEFPMRNTRKERITILETLSLLYNLLISLSLPITP